MSQLNMKCPECGYTEGFQIACSTVAYIDEDGVQDHNDMEYDSSSVCWCPGCNHVATVSQFSPEDAA